MEIAPDYVAEVLRIYTEVILKIWEPSQCGKEKNNNRSFYFSLTCVKQFYSLDFLLGSTAI